MRQNSLGIRVARGGVQARTAWELAWGTLNYHRLVCVDQKLDVYGRR